jgi:hypothetical protein
MAESRDWRAERDAAADLPRLVADHRDELADRP